MNKCERIKQRIKQNWQENKKVYIGTGAGLATGAMAMCLYARYNKAIVIQYKPQNSPVTLTQIVELVRRGHPGKVILDKETGEKYASINRAAEAIGKYPAFVRDNLGKRFEYLGDAT